MASLARKVRTPAEDLEAAVLPALIERSVWVDDHVADLSGRAMGAAVQLSVDDQPAADPRRPRYVDHVAGAPTGAAVELSEACHVGVVRETGGRARGVP